MRLPLFPLHNVLCPGVALPLHVFEERYRVMVGRCIEAEEPFGVVFIREGREVGQLNGRVADVGTTAVIRQAGRYPDGRLDIVTVGAQRFRVQRVDDMSEPFLVGDVEMLDEEVGDEGAARVLADRIGRRFMRYLELLQPALATDDGPEIEIEVEIEAPDDVAAEGDLEDPGPQPIGDLALVDPKAGIDTSSLSDEQRRHLLMAAARRLVTPGDPTALSYLLTGLIQVELPRRQELLEIADTVSRLTAIQALLEREIGLLSRDLRPLALDPRTTALRRN